MKTVAITSSSSRLKSRFTTLAGDTTALLLLPPDVFEGLCSNPDELLPPRMTGGKTKTPAPPPPPVCDAGRESGRTGLFAVDDVGERGAPVLF